PASRRHRRRAGGPGSRLWAPASGGTPGWLDVCTPDLSSPTALPAEPPPLLTPAERAQRAETAARRAQWLGEPPARRPVHLLDLRQRALEHGLQLVFSSANVARKR